MATQRATARDPSLDGIRGIAALVVVVHHSLLSWPPLADPYATAVAVRDVPAWFVYTPLHLLYGGGEAVLVFFVLSGYVLALGFLGDSRRPSWLSYYVRRPLRLYVPVWGALAVAAAAFVVVPRTHAPGFSWWLSMHDAPVTSRAVVDDIVLVRRTPQLLDPVLWSLKWEVLFSALLPLYLFVERSTRRVGGWAIGAALVGLLALGAGTATEWLVYLPVFGLGVLLASRRAAVRGAVSPRVALLLAVAAAPLLSARWLVAGVLGPDRAVRALSVVPYATAIGPALGATAVVALAMAWRPLRRGLERPAVQWLGARSFSLYLVHEPIIVSAALLAGGFHPLAAIAGAGVALLAAELFWRAVERPSLELARRAGRAVTRPRRRPFEPAASAAP